MTSEKQTWGAVNTLLLEQLSDTETQTDAQRFYLMITVARQAAVLKRVLSFFCFCQVPTVYR